MDSNSGAPAKSTSVLSQSRLLVLNQVIVRLFTFITNIFVVRRVGAAVFGLASVNLFLLYTSVIIISQEGIRKAANAAGYGIGSTVLQSQLAQQSAQPGGPQSLRARSRSIRAAVLASSHNVAWLVLPLAVAVAGIAVYLYLNVLPMPSFASSSQALESAAAATAAESAAEAEYRLSVWAHGAAAVVEAAAAPLYVFAQRRGDFRARLVTEAPGNVLRCVVTLVLALAAAGQSGGGLNSGSATGAAAVTAAAAASASASAGVGLRGGVVRALWSWLGALGGSGLMAFTLGQLAYSCYFCAAYFWIFAQAVLRNQKKTAKGSVGAGGREQLELSGDASDSELEFMSLPSLFPLPPRIAAAYANSNNSNKPRSQSQPQSQSGKSSSSGGVGAECSLPFFDPSLLRVWLSFASHSLGKLAVQEGGNLLLVSSSALSPESMGAMALVSNLGSIPVRMLFLPLEEAAAVGFAQAVRGYRVAMEGVALAQEQEQHTLALQQQQQQQRAKGKGGNRGVIVEADAADHDDIVDHNNAENADDDNDDENSTLVDRRPGAKKSSRPFPNNSGSAIASASVIASVPSAVPASVLSAAAAASESLSAVVSSLCTVTRTVTTVGGVFAAFGPPLSLLAIDLLYGANWSRGEAPASLACYSLLIPVLALNGVGEAFVNAAASSQTDLNRIGTNMVLFSIAYIALSAMAMRLDFGARGEIGANAASMALRAAVAFKWTHRALMQRQRDIVKVTTYPDNGKSSSVSVSDGDAKSSATASASAAPLAVSGSWWHKALPSRRTLTLLCVASVVLWTLTLTLVMPMCAAPVFTAAHGHSGASLNAAAGSGDSGSGSGSDDWWLCDLSQATAREKLWPYAASAAAAAVLALAVGWSAALDAGMGLGQFVRNRGRVDKNK